jgi:hypothetical protein
LNPAGIETSVKPTASKPQPQNCRTLNHLYRFGAATTTLGAEAARRSAPKSPGRISRTTFRQKQK